METFEQAPAADSPQKRSPRRWLRWLAATALVLILLCAGVVGGLVLRGPGARKSSEPYRMALEQAQQDPLVTERLGEPIEEASWFPAGNLNVEKDRGDANLHFTVQGPNGKATVSTMARRISGQWGLTTLNVTFEDGERLSLEDVFLKLTAGEGR